MAMMALMKTLDLLGRERHVRRIASKHAATPSVTPQSHSPHARRGLRRSPAARRQRLIAGSCQPCAPLAPRGVQGVPPRPTPTPTRPPPPPPEPSQVVHRERSRGQYRGAEYLLAKLVAELPLDASFAAAFGLGLKWRCGLRATAARLAESVGLAHAPQRAIAAALRRLVQPPERAPSLRQRWRSLASPPAGACARRAPLVERRELRSPGPCRRRAGDLARSPTQPPGHLVHLAARLSRRSPRDLRRCPGRTPPSRSGCR